MISQRTLLASHADIVGRRSPAALDATALRMRAPGLDELFAYLATNGRLGAGDLRRELERGAEDDVSSLIARSVSDPEWLLRMGRVMALQRVELDHERVGLRIILAALRLGAPLRGVQDYAFLLGQLMLAQREHEALRELLPSLGLGDHELASLRTDLENPFVGEGDPQRWLGLLSGFFPDGVPLRLRDDGAHPFDRIEAVADRSVDGPKVSVVVSCYRPTADLITAVRSITAQSWANVEVLVVDDGSGPAFEPMLDEVASLDPRVRILRSPENGGTYACRNLALSFARGEYLTFQDSDDWSHPLRIELQVAPMIANPKVRAAISRCMRLDDNLVITSPGYAPVRSNASSLMFRISDMIGSLGYFDPVRKGADTEFIRRLTAHFGTGLKRIDHQLALYRLRSSSLSRSDFTPGWHHPRRQEYQMSFTEWHDCIRTGTSSAFVLPTSAERKFPAPAAFRSQPSLKRRASFDVVLVGDWRAEGGPQRSMLQEIAALMSDGARVGVAHLEAVRFMTERVKSLCDPIRQLMRNGTVEWVHLDDSVDVGLVILRYPPILQFPPAYPANWNVERMWIVANEGPADLDGSDVRYLPAACTESARRLFGVEPVWVPQGPMVRTAVADAPGHDHFDLAPFDSPGIINPGDWAVGRRASTRPAVGRYSRDYLLKFPATADELLSVYDDPRVDVVMMGATKSVPELLGDRAVPDNWTLREYGSLRVQEFLGTIDFFVYFDNPNRCEAFGRSMLEAAASERVVVLPERFRPTFGPCAVYCEAERAIDVVMEYAEDRDRYDAQVAAANAHIAEQFSGEAFLRRVRPFLAPRSVASVS